jgi:hypothetical protein
MSTSHEELGSDALKFVICGILLGVVVRNVNINIVNIGYCIREMRAEGILKRKKFECQNWSLVVIL